MPTYLLLTTLSPQGIQTLQVIPERLIEFNREIESIGVRVIKQWALLGPYDMLSLVEAPDSLAISRLAADMASRGSAHIDTLTAIPMDAFTESLGPGDPSASGDLTPLL